MAQNEKVKFSKESIIRDAKSEVNKEVGEKYKKKYKDLLKQKVAAELVVSNIDREIEDLEIRMDQELT